MQDNQLAHRIKMGDQAAFKHTFMVFFDALVAYATTLTHDEQEAKDLVQNAFIALWNKRGTLAADSNLKNYLHKITFNLFANQYSKKKLQRKYINELKREALDHYILEQEHSPNHRVKKLNNLIDSLPPRCQKILIMNKHEGKKYSEIAEQLDISVKTVEAQMRIAYQKIRDGFGHEGSFHALILLFWLSL